MFFKKTNTDLEKVQLPLNAVQFECNVQKKGPQMCINYKVKHLWEYSTFALLLHTMSNKTIQKHTYNTKRKMIQTFRYISRWGREAILRSPDIETVCVFICNCHEKHESFCVVSHWLMSSVVKSSCICCLHVLLLSFEATIFKCTLLWWGLLKPIRFSVRPSPFSFLISHFEAKGNQNAFTPQI